MTRGDTTHTLRRSDLATGARSQRWVLFVTMVGVAASAFPTTLLSASLPDIAEDLHTSTSVISWVQAAPSIAFAVGMPFFGKLGDLYGHRRTFVLGFTAMTIGALATAFAWNAGRADRHSHRGAARRSRDEHGGLRVDRLGVRTR